MATRPSTPRRGDATTYGSSDLRYVVLCNALLPMLIYFVASKYTSQLIAMALQSLPPLGRIVYQMLVQRKADAISLVQVSAIVACLVLMTLLDDPRVALLKDPLTFMCFAVAFAIPLVHDQFNLLWIKYRLLNETSPADAQYLDDLWSLRPVRRRFRALSALWGLVIFAEDSLRVYLIFHCSLDLMVYISPIIGTSCMVLLVAYTYEHLRAYAPLKDASDDETRPLLRA
ncbi:hypothetical protein SPRG_04466 [Saprolegnia parasitica CBS 223.65]|uniref:Uncharacterized protein n=1 Tax=Saprolegnia parasitica (strain CBS 223.65) TaxID=695850 RepID=A0A067CMV6_SAPPC|nr:hypothetical protein SPRG_04466 [Saprolegnia parasitica CBS 223.65]KDO30565.1 hypothetical protein SPRG_04466 [Saprolegnia parasitica CBS 223.65]|eukprot:XP_012198780.1 hypothetical protein SPRG_04466 [Saprolegnia parasitica CBS 223.65]